MSPGPRFLRPHESSEEKYQKNLLRHLKKNPRKIIRKLSENSWAPQFTGKTWVQYYNSTKCCHRKRYSAPARRSGTQQKTKNKKTVHRCLCPVCSRRCRRCSRRRRLSLHPKQNKNIIEKTKRNETIGNFEWLTCLTSVFPSRKPTVSLGRGVIIRGS